MSLLETQLAKLRAQQLEYHEKNMVNILMHGQDEYVDIYMLGCQESFKKDGLEFPWDLQVAIYNIANACIEHLFKTLSYD